MLVETHVLNFLSDLYDAGVAIAIFAASVALLYASLIAGFAALKDLQLVEGRLRFVLAAMLAVGVLSAGSICPVYALGIIPPAGPVVTLIGVPVNAVVGFIASFAYRDYKRWEVVVFWVIAGLALDAIAMQLNGGVCETFDRLYLR
ncbi:MULTISPECIES: hypothetical protein [unclassified Archaeoglobus]|jgi:hypothetical protein|uniref:hypothetical protein n=1 Tax=unclassified Archaeoglobus TaxID=2643606 RepID=UPI0025C3F451|nr:MULTISPECIES: hypothetical protein [unclassified Archaeoglobus]